MIQNCFTLLDSNQFKVDRLEIIVVSKNISVCRNCLSVNDIRLGMEVIRLDSIQDLSVALYHSILITHQLLSVQF